MLFFDHLHARYVDGVTIRLLDDGDTTAVTALLDRLGASSRGSRFGGAKPRLTDKELELLACVDATHHVLVAYVGGDRRPAAMARFVRNGRSAELAFEVADVYQDRGIATILAAELAADARAAGITEVSATVWGDNPRAVALLKRFAPSVHITWNHGECAFTAHLNASRSHTQNAHARATDTVKLSAPASDRDCSTGNTSSR